MEMIFTSKVPTESVDKMHVLSMIFQLFVSKNMHDSVHYLEKLPLNAAFSSDATTF